MYFIFCSSLENTNSYFYCLNLEFITRKIKWTYNTIWQWNYISLIYYLFYFFRVLFYSFSSFLKTHYFLSLLSNNNCSYLTKGSDIIKGELYQTHTIPPIHLTSLVTIFLPSNPFIRIKFICLYLRQSSTLVH